MGMGSRIGTGFHPPRQQHPGKVFVGEYFHSARSLYRVEDADDRQALIEDCMSGELIVIEIPHLLELEHVRR